MKPVIKNRPVICVLLLLSFYFVPSPCKGQETVRFQGRWELDLGLTLEIMADNSKIEYDSLPAEVRTRAIESMRDRAFTFENDSVYVNWSTKGQKRISKGTWSFDLQKAELSITVGSDKQRFQVTVLESRALIIENKMPFGFFYRMYLKKQ